MVKFGSKSSSVRLCWELKEPKGPERPYTIARRITTEVTNLHGGHYDSCQGLSLPLSALVGKTREEGGVQLIQSSSATETQIRKLRNSREE